MSLNQCVLCTMHCATREGVCVILGGRRSGIWSCIKASRYLQQNYCITMLSQCSIMLPHINDVQCIHIGKYKVNFYIYTRMHLDINNTFRIDFDPF